MGTEIVCCERSVPITLPAERQALLRLWPILRLGEHRESFAAPRESAQVNIASTKPEHDLSSLARPWTEKGFTVHFVRGYDAKLAREQGLHHVDGAAAAWLGLTSAASTWTRKDSHRWVFLAEDTANPKVSADHMLAALAKMNCCAVWAGWRWISNRKKASVVRIAGNGKLFYDPNDVGRHYPVGSKLAVVHSEFLPLFALTGIQSVRGEDVRWRGLVRNGLMRVQMPSWTSTPAHYSTSSLIDEDSDSGDEPWWSDQTQWPRVESFALSTHLAVHQ